MRKITLFCLFALSLVASAQTHVLDVNTKKLGAPVQPTMYGIFFEDINYAADGGLYAEMVKKISSLVLRMRASSASPSRRVPLIVSPSGPVVLRAVNLPWK